jgi:hypothetical protein
MRGIARRFGYGSLVALVIALALLQLYRPKLHALQGAILLTSLVIVWLGLELATEAQLDAAAIVSRANLLSASSGSPSG